jgi:hypothetical protein
MTKQHYSNDELWTMSGQPPPQPFFHSLARLFGILTVAGALAASALGLHAVWQGVYRPYREAESAVTSLCAKTEGCQRIGFYLPGFPATATFAAGRDPSGFFKAFAALKKTLTPAVANTLPLHLTVVYAAPAQTAAH